MEQAGNERAKETRRHSDASYISYVDASATEIALWLRKLHKIRRSTYTGYHNHVIASAKEIALWLRRLEPELRHYLLATSDPARVVSLWEFDRALTALATMPLNIAVVSGSAHEPELRLLGSGYTLTQLNYEDDPALFDLTLDWSTKPWKKFHGRFDLVLCEQVLEHLPEPQRAFDNLKVLARDGGLIHVSTPALNNTHGEPYFYFSGFHPRALAHFAHKTGFAEISIGAWASNKASRMYGTCDWAPLAESGPLRFYFMSLPYLLTRPKKLARTTLNRMRNMALYPFQPLFSRTEATNYVVSWLFATK